MFCLRNRKRFQNVYGIVAVVFLLTSLSACVENDARTALFYPVDSLLNAQVHMLSQAKAGLKKKAVLGEEVSEVNYVPSDTTAWQKELVIFHQAELINKPVNRGLYK